jgi:hypothetical protein
MIVTIRSRRDAAVWRCVRRIFDQRDDPREAIDELLLEWNDAAADAWLSGEAERGLEEQRGRVLAILRETDPDREPVIP